MNAPWLGVSEWLGGEQETSLSITKDSVGGRTAGNDWLPINPEIYFEIIIISLNDKISL